MLHLNVNILNAGVFGGSWRFLGTDGDEPPGALAHGSTPTRHDGATSLLSLSEGRNLAVGHVWRGDRYGPIEKGCQRLGLAQYLVANW